MRRSGDSAADALVVGGGPAGASAALTLLRAGLSCVVLERTNYDGLRIGETVSPLIQEPLRRLGLWDQFVGSDHRPSYGIRSAWGASDLHHQDFLLSPYGKGWHLDRNRFDRMLIEAVRRIGGEVQNGARLESAVFDGEFWTVAAMRSGRGVELHARYLLDATGRTAAVARHLGARQIVYDRLVSEIAFFAPIVCEHEIDDWLLLESVENGWWYSAPLPDQRALAVFMTDADLLRRRSMSRSENWWANLNQTRHTKARFRHRPDLMSMATRPAQSRLLDCRDLSRFVAIGDAAMSFDPLSAQGIEKAILSGIRAAGAVIAFRDGDRHALDFCKSEDEAEFSDYLVQRSDYYTLETRWPGAAFWCRRRDPNPGPV